MMTPEIMKVITACILAWLIPGAGHIFLSRWKRGIVFLAVIVALFVLGLSMHGRLYSLSPGFFGLLKFVAGLATGIPYMLGRSLGLGGGDITAFDYEYGNTYLYTAGLLNMLLIVDACDIARGEKS